MRAVVAGLVATYPVGGMAWHYLQYVRGLEQIGYEVAYLEDSGWQSFDPSMGDYGESFTYGVDFLRDAIATIVPELGDRWHVRMGAHESAGMSLDDLAEFVATAEVLLNVSGGCLMRDEYLSCPRKVFIDTDPGPTQMVNLPKWDRHPGWQGTHGFRAHDAFFTFAERMACDDCRLPDLGLAWLPTRQPIATGAWSRTTSPRSAWTTLMSWRPHPLDPIVADGVEYQLKQPEFERLVGLPAVTPVPLEVAVGGHMAPVGRWREAGWSVVDALQVTRTAGTYREYVGGSRGEISAAKQVYVATRSGWFSERSACYLAAGRPVVIQDTGFTDVLPTGDGIVPFTTPAGAAGAILAVESDHAHHVQAARQIAEDHFDARRVLADLLVHAGVR